MELYTGTLYQEYKISKRYLEGAYRLSVSISEKPLHASLLVSVKAVRMYLTWICLKCRLFSVKE